MPVKRRARWGLQNGLIVHPLKPNSVTAAELLGLITTALLIQLALGMGVVLRRRRIAAQTTPAPPPSGAPIHPHLAWQGWREFRVTQRDFEDRARSQCSFYLQPVDGQPLAAFQPGQFLTFWLEVADKPITRCYSLSDRPHPGHYRVTIKRVPAPPDHPEFLPGQSSNHFHNHVQVGDVVRVKAPSGHFFIDPDPSVPVVLIGGGIGITPMMSMLLWCTTYQPQRTVHLFYGLRNSEEQAYKPQIEHLAASHPALRLHVTYSRPTATDVMGRDHQHTGHVDIELLRQCLPHGRHQFYLCGPPAMMQTLVPALVEWGVPVADIRYEAFGPASVKLPGASASAAAVVSGVEVKFKRSGRTLVWHGEEASLLDFAERHGIPVASGCRSGGCGSCETRVLDGSVSYEHTPDHALTQGHCLLCVGRPATSLVLEA